MSKKLKTAALFCVIALQLAAVTGFIGYYLKLDDDIVEKGVELRFRVELVSVDEAGVVTYRPQGWMNYGSVIVLGSSPNIPIYVGADGFAYFGALDESDTLGEVPETDLYLNTGLPNAFPNHTEFASGNTALYEGQSGRYGHAKYLEEYYRGSPYDRDENAPETRQPEAYVTVALYRGHAEVTGLYIAGADVRTLSALPEPVPAKDPPDAAS